jgi:hypothetical protein
MIAAVIACPGAGIANPVDMACRDRQQEESRRQEYRQPCHAGIFA